MAKYIQEVKSRSQAKRELKAVQELADTLANMADSELEPLELPGDLLAAIRQARSTPRKSYQRQIKHVAKLLRGVELEPIWALLGQHAAAKTFENDVFHQLEAWRDGLLAGNEDTLREVLERFPDLDEVGLRELANAARAEAESGKPPKFSRQLFRVLRRYLQQEIDNAEEDWD